MLCPDIFASSQCNKRLSKYEARLGLSSDMSSYENNNNSKKLINPPPPPTPLPHRTPPLHPAWWKWKSELRLWQAQTEGGRNNKDKRKMTTTIKKMFGSLCIVVPLGSVRNQSVFKDAVIARSTRWLTRPGSQPRSHPDVAHQIPASLRSPARLPASAAPPSPPPPPADVAAATVGRLYKLGLKKRPLRRGNGGPAFLFSVMKWGKILIHDTLCCRSWVRFASSDTPLGPLPCRCVQTDRRPAEIKQIGSVSEAWMSRWSLYFDWGQECAVRVGLLCFQYVHTSKELLILSLKNTCDFNLFKKI